MSPDYANTVVGSKCLVGFMKEIVKDVQNVRRVCEGWWTLYNPLSVISIRRLSWVSTKYVHFWWRGGYSHWPNGVRNFPFDAEHYVRWRAFRHMRHWCEYHSWLCKYFEESCKPLRFCCLNWPTRWLSCNKQTIQLCRHNSRSVSKPYHLLQD